MSSTSIKATLFLYTLTLIFFIGKISGQQNYTEDWKKYDSSYGLNPTLHNGLKYFPSHTKAKGHPFLLYSEGVTGAIVVEDKEFKHVNLKYDLYKQQVVLSFLDYTGALEQIVLNNSLIDTFQISNHVFIKNPFRNIKAEFLQIVYSNQVSCYIQWSKNYEFHNTSDGGIHKYTDEKRTLYLVQNQEVQKFRNRRTFLKLFPEANRKEIKNFIKKNKIRIKKANHLKLQQLVAYCNTILYDA